MALKHRKLFPAPSATNQSADCADFYTCYPYADYYFLPPPLPQPQPPPPPSLLPPEHHISPYVIIIVSLLASFFLVVSYYVIIAKSCPSWLGSRNNRQAQGEADGSDEEFADEDQIDHPIWFITTAGLQQSIINSITVCKYKKGEGLIEGTECSVCLSEFQQDETLRLLPKCNHAFHSPCVDTWLRSHTNCPLCRAHIVSDSVISPLPTANQNPENLNTISSTQMENPEIDGELGNDQERNEHCENRAGAEEGGETVHNGNETISKEDVNLTENSNLEIICESGNDYQGAKSDIQPMRRSVSLDSLTAATMCLSLNDKNPVELVNHTEENAEQHHPQIVLKQEESRKISTFKQMGSCSITQHLHKSPVPMKRSFSCGGRCFSSRQNRNLNLILPL